MNHAKVNSNIEVQKYHPRERHFVMINKKLKARRHKGFHSMYLHFELGI